MKVLVYFSSVKHKANFEGDRLRKTIVGALNRLEVEYTLDTSDDYDIVHLISPLDISIAENAKLKGIPVVFSALYTEGDPQARYIDKSTGIPHLIPSALKALNYASLIFVPSEGAKAFLKDEGVEATIVACPCAVNQARFKFDKDIEKELFWRYFQREPSKEMIICTGEYDNPDAVETFVQVAKRFPSVDFYFFGQEKKWFSLPRLVKKLIRRKPKNTYFNPLIPDDVYRSGMMNALAYILPGYTMSGVVTLMDAMASKTQIIALNKTIFKDEIIDGETGYVCLSGMDLINTLTKFLNKEIPSTVEKAYQIAMDLPLEKLGIFLKNHYEHLIEIKSEKGKKE